MMVMIVVVVVVIIIIKQNSNIDNNDISNAHEISNKTYASGPCFADKLWAVGAAHHAETPPIIKASALGSDLWEAMLKASMTSRT